VYEMIDNACEKVINRHSIHVLPNELWPNLLFLPAHGILTQTQ
jgi:hypothetical protein